MAGHTYMTNGYLNYPDVPPQEGGYDFEPNQHVKWYMVETTTVERVRVPSNGYDNFDDGYNNFDSGYNNFGGAPLKNDYRQEYMPKYPPQGHYEIYDHNYRPYNENAIPPRYHERENLMNNFLNKLQIGASRPTNTSNLFGPNKYRPISPNKYRSKSPTYNYPSREPHFVQPQYLPAPNRYRPISPTKYRPSSPTKYRPTSPNMYRPTSPTKYRPSSPTKYHPSSPTKYRPTSPNKYRPTNPTKYRPTSPAKYQTTSPGNYRPTSPTKYRPISPTMYQPTNLTKFQETNPPKYQPTSPTGNYPLKENHMVTTQTFPGPNMNQHTSPVHNVPSKESQPIGTQSMSDPNNFHPSSMGLDSDRNAPVNEFSDPNNYFQSVSPTVAHKPLTTPTDDTNEALSSQPESTNNAPGAQPIKNEKRFGWNALGATTRRYVKDTIDSKEVLKKYNGAQVP